MAKVACSTASRQGTAVACAVHPIAVCNCNHGSAMGHLNWFVLARYHACDFLLNSVGVFQCLFNVWAVCCAFRWQDENLTPIKEGGQPEQQVPAASRTHMQQQRLRLAASSIRRSAAGPARHAGNLQDERHRQRERPAWQSEPFMPPPAHMLRKKISGVADAWGLPPPVRAPGKKLVIKPLASGQ